MSTITISEYDVEKLRKTLDDIWRNTNKTLPDLVKQTTYWALISATKATGPGNKSRVSKLQQKYKVRPFKSSVRQGLFYDNVRFYRKDNGDIFGTKKAKLITKKSRAKHGLTLINTGYKKWSKKKKSFILAPYFREKKDKEAKELQIPHAGAAKYGWLGGVGKIGYDKGGWDTANLDNTIKRKANIVKKKSNTEEVSIMVDNIIDYVLKISPSSGRVGLRKADNKMRKIYEKEIQKAIDKATGKA